MTTGNFFSFLLALERRKRGEGNHSHDYGRRRVEGGFAGCSGYGVFCQHFFIPHHSSRGAQARFLGDRILAFFCSMVFFFNLAFPLPSPPMYVIKIPSIVGLQLAGGRPDGASSAEFHQSQLNDHETMPPLVFITSL
jgi:hypothetical protein